MGKSCFFICKKPSISKTKVHKDDQKPNNKTKKRWFVRQKSNDSVSLPGENPSTDPPPPSSPPPPQPHLPSSKEVEEEHIEQALTNKTAITAVIADQDTAKDIPVTEYVPLENVETKEDDQEQPKEILPAVADDGMVQGTAEVVPLTESIPLENVETKEDKEDKEDKEEQSEPALAIPSATMGSVTVQVTVEVVPLTESVTIEDGERETRQDSVIPTAMAVSITAEDAAEVAALTESVLFAGNSSEEAAAIKLQTAYRAYMGRRALRALRELWRLKPSVKGQNNETQSTTSTLHSMQTLARVQSDIRHKRTRLCEEQQNNNNNNNTRQSLISHKHNKSNKSPPRIGEDWDVSTKSKEQIEASLLLRKEAAERRERALAYASSHQQARKSSSKIPHQTDKDPQDPQWGWRWLEQWMAVRPWEIQSRDSNTDPNDQNPVKTPDGCEPTTTHAAKSQKTRPRQKTRKGFNSDGGIHGVGDSNDDLKSIQSVRYNHRHSSAHVGSSSSVKDDNESESDKPLVKKTAKARASLSTSPGHSASRKINKNDLEKKKPVGSMKKRLSFSDMPTGTKRLADPVNGAMERRSNSGRVNHVSEE